MKAKWMMKIVLGAIVFGALAGWLVMSLWNWLMPAIFGLTAITFIQALGLLVLSRILFGGFRGGRGGYYGRHRRHERWHMMMEKRMAGMTEEEKARFREKYRHRCYPDDAPATEEK